MFLLVAVLPLPKELKIDAGKVGYESIGFAFGYVGMLYAGNLALFLNNFFPEFAEGIHGIVF